MSQAGAFSRDLLLDTFLREHGPEALEVPGVTELMEDEDPGSSLYRHVPGPRPLPLRVGGLWAVLTGAALGSPGRALEQTPQVWSRSQCPGQGSSTLAIRMAQAGSGGDASCSSWPQSPCQGLLRGGYNFRKGA